MSAAAKRHLARIGAMDCICCSLLGRKQESKTDCHHLRDGHGAAQRASDWLTMPLCHDDCHQGANGVHGSKTYLRLLKVGEVDLLAATIERLMRGAR